LVQFGTKIDPNQLQPYLDAFFDLSVKHISTYKLAKHIASQLLSKFAIQDMGIQQDEEGNATPESVEHCFQLDKLVVAGIQDAVEQTEPTLVMLQQAIPQNIFLMAPINPRGHLVCSLNGLPTVKMLGWNYNILMDCMRKHLERLNYLCNHDIVPNNNYSLVVTTESFIHCFATLRPEEVSAQEVTCAYLGNAQARHGISPQGQSFVEDWRHNIGPSGPFELLQSKISAPKAFTDAFLPCKPELHPQMLSYNQDSSKACYHHHPQTTSLGQLPDWQPPPPSPLALVLTLASPHHSAAPMPEPAAPACKKVAFSMALEYQALAANKNKWDSFEALCWELRSSTAPKGNLHCCRSLAPLYDIAQPQYGLEPVAITPANPRLSGVPMPVGGPTCALATAFTPNFLLDGPPPFEDPSDLSDSSNSDNNNQQGTGKG
jgi:hypothetical protein